MDYVALSFVKKSIYFSLRINDLPYHIIFSVYLGQDAYAIANLIELF